MLKISTGAKLMLTRFCGTRNFIISLTLQCSPPQDQFSDVERCRKVFLGYTKLMVATGRVGSGTSSNVEIIDLEISTSSCQNLEEYPLKLQEGSGGLSLEESPLICGGHDNVDFDACHYFGNNEWKVFPSLTEAKRQMKSTKSPFLHFTENVKK